MDTAADIVDEMNEVRKRLRAKARKTERRLPKTHFWSISDLPPEVVKNIDYNVTPLYEETMNDYITEKHYSLERNEILSENWKYFKEHPGMVHVSEYFARIDHRDYHFYNYYVRFMPSLSERWIKPRGFTLRGKGPEVDHLGVVPLPAEQITMREELYRTGVDMKQIERQKKMSKDKILTDTGKTNSKGKVKGKVGFCKC